MTDTPPIDVELDEHPPGAVGPDGRIPAPDPKLGPFAGLIDRPGIAAFDATIDGSWWAQRPLWLAGPLLFAVPLFALTGPRRTPTDRAR